MQKNQLHSHICPLAAIDRRLEDVHRQWHEAESKYFDPEAFRVAIQSVIQTLRTVTFIIQSNRRLIPNFEPWYKDWQDKLRKDTLMKWMVDARNKIEKQGDLESHSVVRVELIASYLNEGPIKEVPSDIFDTTDIIIGRCNSEQLHKHISDNGTIRIQRRWVENTLKGYELLDAASIAYGQIALLVDDAHRQAGIAKPQTVKAKSGELFDHLPDGRLRCMIGHSEPRTMHVSLAHNGHREFCLDETVVPTTPAQKQDIIEKIPEILNPVTGNEKILEKFFIIGRSLMVNDGHHITILFLLKEGIPIKFYEMRPEYQGDKYIMMRKLSVECEKYGADAAIMIGEAWISQFDPDKPYLRPSQSEQKSEILLATLVRKDGDTIQLSSEITRTDNKIILGKTNIMRGGAEFMFAPFYEVWNIPIPTAWIELVKRANSMHPVPQEDTSHNRSQ